MWLEQIWLHLLKSRWTFWSCLWIFIVSFSSRKHIVIILKTFVLCRFHFTVFFLITLKHSALKIRPHHRRHCWELMKTYPARSQLRPLRLPLFVLLQMGRRSNKPSILAGHLNQLLLQEVVNSGLKVSMKITNWKWAFVKCFNINMLCCGGSSCRHKM